MANNPYVNKVEYAGNTIIDISDTTATEEDVLQGKVFYDGSGKRSIGSIGTATHEQDGLMSAEDKIKLDNACEDIGVIGTLYSNSGDTNISSNTWETGKSIEVPAGTYIVRYTARSNTGTVRVGSSTSTGSWSISNGAYSLAEHIEFIVCNAVTTFTCYLYSASAITCSNSVSAIRIK